MTTITAIAAEAIAAVKLEITGAFVVMNLIEPTQGTYSRVTGTTPDGETDHGTVDAIFDTEKPVRDEFPDYIAGEGDKLLFFHNVTNTTLPVKGWVMRGGGDYIINAAQNILENGTIFYAVVRKDG